MRDALRKTVRELLLKADGRIEPVLPRRPEFQWRSNVTFPPRQSA